jgi:hypothetical protein|tara:strand:- start:14097 stop:14234 length:138 start_codon:yes stop_codon:yes gene_type:complete
VRGAGNDKTHRLNNNLKIAGFFNLKAISTDIAFASKEKNYEVMVF